jgi:hypothetical protein
VLVDTVVGVERLGDRVVGVVLHHCYKEPKMVPLVYARSTASASARKEG